MSRYIATGIEECRALDAIDGSTVYVLTEDGVERATLCLAPVLPARQWFSEEDGRECRESLRDWTRGIG